MRLIVVALCALLFSAPAMASTVPLLSADDMSPIMPDTVLTPGVTMTSDMSVVCHRSTKTVRDVPESEKLAVYHEYGIASHKPGDFEIDHLISLELGGSNDIKNLWPQSYLTQPWNAHVKDRLENRLHELVCAGKLSLPDAQHAIATDWISAYKLFVGPEPTPAP